MKLRQIKHRAYALSHRIAERNLWKLETISSVMQAILELKSMDFVHDPSKVMTKFTPPKSLQVALGLHN